MFRFDCPSCKQTLNAGEEFAGKRILCPHCNLAAPVPTNADPNPQGITSANTMPTPPRDSTDDDLVPDPPPSIRGGGPFAWFSGRVIFYGIVIFVVLPIILALFVQPAQKAPHHAMRTQSINNLKNLALGVHAFFDSHKRLPFNGSDEAVGDAKYSAKAQPGRFTSGSWAFQILPFVDHQPAFDRVDRTQAIVFFLCPARGRPAIEENRGAWSDYFLNNYLNDPKRANRPDTPDRKRTLLGIADGSSNTVLLAHGSISTKQYTATAHVFGSTNIFLGGTRGTMRSGDNGERAPTGVTLRRDSADFPASGSWGGPFEHGALIALCDGTVRMFPYTTQNFSSFLTPAGNEAVEIPD